MSVGSAPVQPADPVQLIAQELKATLRRKLIIKGKPVPLFPADLAAVGFNYIERYRRDLRRLRNGNISGDLARAAAFERLSHSVAAKALATLRVLASQKRTIELDALNAIATTFDLRAASTEPATIVPIAKDDGSFRPTISFGPRRRAQHYLLDDMLNVLGVESPFDFMVAGRGGYLGAVNAIRAHILNGVAYWVTGDVTNFFASLEPKHVSWLPLPQETVRHVLFGTRHAQLLGEKGGKGFTTSVRQGLPQGAITSPRIAGAFLGRELRALVGKGVAVVVHGDNIAFGACSPVEASGVAKALTQRLGTHPAGPLIVRFYGPTHACDGFVFCKLRFTLETTGPTSRVHIRPTGKSFASYAERLRHRLAVWPDGELLDRALGFAATWARGTGWDQTEDAKIIHEVATIGLVEDEQAFRAELKKKWATLHG